MFKKSLFAVFLILATSLFAPADEPEKKDASKPEFKAEFPKEASSETKHTIEIAGKTIAYTATAGTIVLKEENGRPKASVFYIAYARDGADPATRPVTFSFNGGPGSSSVWLHMGLLGPKRVKLKDDGTAYPPPYPYEDNAYSMLDTTDLVFIDPISTGYSRAVPGEDPKQYFGVKEDIESVGDFIRLYTTRHKRWSSPKYLIGESYGTTRAAGLVGYLQDHDGMYFNGVILVSVAIDFATLDFTPGNELPFFLYVPTYATTAWYHKKLPADLQQLDVKSVADQARAFAINEYGPALLKGDQLSDEQKNSVAEKLARFTGLSPSYIKSANLRISDNRFYKELQRDRRLITGRLDSRFTGFDVDAAGEQPEYDPAMASIMGEFTGAFNDYVRRELKFEQNDVSYATFSHQIQDWNVEPQFKGRHINTGDDLRRAMNENPALRIFVANGYYDLATPFCATEYTFSHLGLEPQLRKNVSLHYYEGGHMMYIVKPSLVQLKTDLSKFYQPQETLTGNGR